MDKLRHKNTLIFLSVTIICLTVITTTYGFIKKFNNDSNMKTSITTGTMSLSFTDGNQSISGTLDVGESTSPKELVLENTGTLPVTATLEFKSLTNTYLRTSLSYTLKRKISSSGTYEEVHTKNVPTGTKDAFPIYTETDIPSGAKYYYQIIITFNDLDGVDQEQDLSASFGTKFTVVEVPTQILVDTIKDKSNPLNSTDFTSKEAYEFNEPATEQLGAVTEYRYVGSDPNNYVSFNCDEDGTNCELWRAIGVFETQKTIGGATEQRVKLIRESSIGNIAWDTKETWGKNEWSTAELKTLLNEGDYYNRSGTYATKGLKTSAKNMIEDAVFYLGGARNYDSATDGLTSHWYGYERGTDVYSSDRTTVWTGKVGLMYPSDYGLATSGGDILDRTACLEKELNNWGSGDYKTNCAGNSYLKKTSDIWTITPRASTSTGVFDVRVTGFVGVYSTSSAIGVLPVVYLTSDIVTKSGDGTRNDPYILE